MHIAKPQVVLGVTLDGERLVLSKRERAALGRACAIALQARALCRNAGLIEADDDDEIMLAWAEIGPAELLEWAS